MIKEDLVQFIWQFQYFNNHELTTLDGERVEVIKAGRLNTNQGPDFLDAKIKIGDTVWAGSIEIHIKTSDWEMHRHSLDNRYENVILHVVWQHDKKIDRELPTIELENLVSFFLLEKYQKLMQNQTKIPCQNLVKPINELSLTIWKEKLLLERLKIRSEEINKGLNDSHNDLEEYLWQRLARSFGSTLNTDLFEAIAKAIPLKIISRHRNNFLQVESLLLGGAGLLESDFNDAYPLMLQKEYRFLEKKYNIPKNPFPISYLRMRPANFPTIRLAQLASLIYRESQLFGKIMAAGEVADLENLLEVKANDYWHYHYLPDVETPFKIKNLGTQMKHSIIINAFIPIACSCAISRDDDLLLDKAITWLQNLPAEKNSITKLFNSIGISNKNAGESQALIQLKNNYCDKRRCLECSIGNSILKNNFPPQPHS